MTIMEIIRICPLFYEESYIGRQGRENDFILNTQLLGMSDEEFVQLDADGVCE